MTFNKSKFFLVSSLLVFFTLYSPPFFYTSNTGLILLALSVYFFRGECYQFIIQNKKALGLLFTALVLGIVFSELPAKSIKGTYDFLRGFVLIFPAAICAWLYPEYKNFFEKSGALITLGGSILLGLFSLSFSTLSNESSFKTYIYKFAGTYFGNVHNLINGVAFLFLFCITLLVWSSLSKPWKLSLCLCFSGMLLFLYFCQSEGTYLAFLLSLLVYLFLMKKHWRRAVSLLLVLISVFYILLFMFPVFVQHTVSFSLGGVSARSQIYSSVINAVLDAPLFGYGINTYKYISAGQVSQIDFAYLFPHQILLEALFSFGFVGFFCFILSFVYFFRNIHIAAISKNLIHVFGLLSLIYLLGKGMTDGKLFGFYYSGLLGMSSGFLLGWDGYSNES